jgi:hypothetical protein
VLLFQSLLLLLVAVAAAFDDGQQEIIRAQRQDSLCVAICLFGKTKEGHSQGLKFPCGLSEQISNSKTIYVPWPHHSVNPPMSNGPKPLSSQTVIIQQLFPSRVKKA